MTDALDGIINLLCFWPAMLPLVWRRVFVIALPVTVLVYFLGLAIAGALLADRVLYREQLEAEGWRFVEPGYMALPRDRKEAEMMSVIADAYLNQPEPPDA